MAIRRVVTGVDAEGTSVFVSDERDLDAERFMRQERRSEYARIIAHSRAVVEASDKALTAAKAFGASNDLAERVIDQAAQARHEWRVAWAEVELVASNEVNDHLSDINELLGQYEGALAAVAFVEYDLVTERGWRRAGLAGPEDFAEHELLETLNSPPLANGVRLIERLVETARLELVPSPMDRS